MKMNVNTLKQQTQDLFLRLFVESSSGIGTTPARSSYTCAHCGTYARMRQYLPDELHCLSRFPFGKRLPCYIVQ